MDWSHRNLKRPSLQGFPGPSSAKLSRRGRAIFKPYSSDELYDILRDRAEAAFQPGALEEGALRLCAAMAAGEHGDARRALDLLRVAGEIGERGREKGILESHVRLAQQKVEHDRVTEV